MTLEAAEQTRIDLKLEEAVVRIRDMHFMAELPLSLLNTDDSTVEVQFSLRSETKQHAFRFDISANLRGSGSGWKQCCVGSLDFTNADHKRIEIPDASGHEPALLDYIASLGVYPKFSFETLRLTHEKASGSFVNLVEDDEHYHLNPTIFSALERLPDALLATSGPAAEYRLESIDLIEAPLGQSSFHKAVFSARTRRTSPLRGMSDIQIHDADCWYLDIKGMTSKLFQPLDIKYPLKSLFFKPVIKPDITFLKSAASLSLQDALELVTHKWPMADLAATDLSDEELEAVQSHMQGIRDCDRPHFRSLTVLRKDDSPSIGRIRVTKAFNRDQSFHFLFGNAGSLTSNVSCVRTDGLACLKLNGDEDQDSVSRHLDIICKIEGFPSGQWLLGRPKPQQNGVNASKKLVVCASEQCDIAELQDYMDFETVRISRDKGSTCHSIRQNMPDEADVIVMDCGYESILTAWAGREVLPWTQLVLERAHNLLWVSNQIDHSPFAGVTGSFIRTIQTEYPSLKASSLVFKDSRYVSRTIFDVYDRMAHGNSETESLAQSGDICALRYRPDDELSASVGMLSPLESERGLGSSEYELSIAGVRKATLVSSRQTNRDPPDGCVKVAVEESLVDYEDVQAYIGIHRAQGDWAGLGHFFAGKVLASGDRITAPGDQVVGWQRGAHKSVMIVSASQILRAPDNMPHTKALVHFAAYAIAFDLIYDIARIRRSETMNVLVPGVLGEALNNACHLAEVDVTNDSARDAAFVVAWNSAQGLLVNGQAVPVRKSKSLASGETSALSIQSVWDCAPLQSQDHVFELRNFQGAFQNAESHPLSTVLRHGRSREVEGDWLSYVPSETLFRADAAYVVVGGLGGLGRYVLLWMISKGARHLVTLSRSGSDSEEAQRTVEAIKQLGAEIKAYKTDACDECAVNDVLAQVREDRPIRGCFNMVLVLDNAPIGTMSGQQWDKVLASKVRSTWILHRATLCDSLDMFIMFSSVSSISGNRTQANYATANSFQNSLAEYRRLQGLTGIAIALGAMRDIGVLAGDDVLLRTLSQSGLQALGPKELDKILEAAVIESHHPERHLISTGFDMFETLDGIVQSRAEQNQLFWTEWPEFGFLLEHNFSTAEVAKVVSLPAQIKDQAPEVAHRILIEAFMICLGAILGYDTASIDPSSSLASCGLDSLNAVSCRYWFFKGKLFPFILVVR